MCIQVNLLVGLAAFEFAVAPARAQGFPVESVQANVSSAALSASGICAVAKPHQPRYVDNGDGTICDSSTGLMWEKKLSCPASVDFNNVHCVENYYYWSSSGSSYKPDGSLFTDFLTNLNRADGSWGDTHFEDIRTNYGDWRIPTLQELLTIVDCTQPNWPNCLDPIFGAVQLLAPLYWTATASASSPPLMAVWAVNFGTGNAGRYGKCCGGFYARAVRGRR